MKEPIAYEMVFNKTLEYQNNNYSPIVRKGFCCSAADDMMTRRWHIDPYCNL